MFLRMNKKKNYIGTYFVRTYDETFLSLASQPRKMNRYLWRTREESYELLLTKLQPVYTWEEIPYTREREREREMYWQAYFHLEMTDVYY